MDRVVLVAAEHDVVAVLRGDDVVPTDGRIDAVQECRQPDHAIGEVALDAVRRLVAEGEDGAPAAEAEAGDHDPSLVEIVDPAAVAEHDVVAGTGDDLVLALAAEHHQRQARVARQHRVVVRQPATAELGLAEEALVRALGVQHEEAVLALVQLDLQVIVAQAGVQAGRGANAALDLGAEEGAVDVEAVVAEAAPDPDTVREVAGPGGAEADRALGQADEVDLTPVGQHLVALAGAHVGVGLEHRRVCRAVGDDAVLVADHQLVAALAGLDVQVAEEIVQVAAQVLGVRAQVEGGGRGDVDALVARAQVEEGVGRRALDVEDVVARAQQDVQGVDAVVVDAVEARRDAGQRRRDDRRGAGDVELEAVTGDVLDHQDAALDPRVELRPAQGDDLRGQRLQHARHGGAGTGRDGDDQCVAERPGDVHVEGHGPGRALAHRIIGRAEVGLDHAGRALEQRGVDGVDLQVAVLALEDQVEHVAVLLDAEVVGERQRIVARDAVELRLDVDRRAVRVQDRAQDLVQVQRAGVVGDRVADDDEAIADGVEELEAQREGPAGGVDGDGLQVRALAVEAAFLHRGGAHRDAGIRRRHQAAGEARLGPLDGSEVEAREAAGEAHRVGHEAEGARLGDLQVFGADEAEAGVGRPQQCRNFVCRVGSVQCHQRRVAVVGHQQLVSARQGLDRDGLDLGHRRHVEAGQRRAGERADVVLGLAAVVENQHVARQDRVLDGQSPGRRQRNRPDLVAHRGARELDDMLGGADRAVRHEDGAVAARLATFGHGAVHRVDADHNGERSGGFHDYGRPLDLRAVAHERIDERRELARHVGQRILLVAAAVDREQRVERVEQVEVVAHDDDVRIGARVHEGVPGDRLDRHRVAARAGVEVGGAAVGGLDGEVVVAAAQPNVQHFHAEVANPAVELAALDDGFVGHAEAGQAVGGQHADVVGRAEAVEDVDGVDLVGLVHPGVRVHRREEVAVAGLGEDALAGESDLGRCQAGCAVEHLEPERDGVAGGVDDHQVAELVDRGAQVRQPQFLDLPGKGLEQRLRGIAGAHRAADHQLGVAVLDTYGPHVVHHWRGGIGGCVCAGIEHRPRGDEAHGVAGHQRQVAGVDLVRQFERERLDAFAGAERVRVSRAVELERPGFACICLEHLEGR